MINLFTESIAEEVGFAINEIPFALWETLYATVLATLFAIIIGLPLGVLLVTGEENNIAPIPKPILSVLNFIINILRSIPFIILMVVVMPITRSLVGTTIGTFASIVPLTIAAFPYIARLVEGSIREVDPNIIEAAESMGSSPWQIVYKVLLPEAVPSLITNFTLAITTILGYTAMSAAFGGGGLGKLAINYGYYRYKTVTLLLSVATLVILVQVFQMVGTFVATKSDKRIKK